MTDKTVTRIRYSAGSGGIAPAPADRTYFAPFIPATMMDHKCVCVGCGRTERATIQISAYPDRYTPDGWSVCGQTRALRCRRCTSASHADGKLHTHYWETHYTLRDTRGDMYSVVRASDETNTRRTRVEEKENPMDTKIDKAKSVGRSLGDAALLGTKLAAVNKAGDALLRIARKLAKDNETLAGLLETDEGREAAKAIVATGLVGLGEFEVFPRGNRALVAVGKLQVTASTFVLLNKYGDLLVDELDTLVSLGAELLGDEPDEASGPRALPSRGVGEMVSLEDEGVAFAIDKAGR